MSFVWTRLKNLTKTPTSTSTTSPKRTDQVRLPFKRLRVGKVYRQYSAKKRENKVLKFREKALEIWLWWKAFGRNVSTLFSRFLVKVLLRNFFYFVHSCLRRTPCLWQATTVACWLSHKDGFEFLIFKRRSFQGDLKFAILPTCYQPNLSLLVTLDFAKFVQRVYQRNFNLHFSHCSSFVG